MTREVNTVAESHADEVKDGRHLMQNDGLGDARAYVFASLERRVRGFIYQAIAPPNYTREFERKFWPVPEHPNYRYSQEREA